MSIILEIAYNEPAIIKSLVLKEALKRKVDAEVVELEVGDFVWDNEICIERKTVPDFVSSVWDGRVFTQAMDMEQYRKRYIIISGNFKGLQFDPRLAKFSVEQKLRAQASLLARTKVKLWQVDNRVQFISALFIIKEKSDKGSKTFVVERHSKTANRLDPNLEMYLRIPGVGAAMAQRIAEDYGNFYELIDDVRKNRKLRTSLSKEGLTFLKKTAGRE